MHTTILGDGHLGWAVAGRRRSRRANARPRPARPAAGTTRPGWPAPTPSSTPRGRCGRRRTSRPASTPASGAFVIATTGWDGRPRRPSSAASADAARPRSSPPNFSLGVALFGRLVEAAARRCSAPSTASIRTSSSGTAGPRLDRPSGTARDLARRHRRAPPAPGDGRRPRGRLDPRRRVAGDAPRRLRCRRRDGRAAPDRARPVAPMRPAILAAADWLGRAPRAGRHPPVRPRRRRAPRPPGDRGLTTRQPTPAARPLRPDRSRTTRHAVPAAPSCAARSPPSSPRSPPTAPSTRPPSGGSSAGRSSPASTASSRAARPASPRP